jgi:hypothetical protein
MLCAEAAVPAPRTAWRRGHGFPASHRPDHHEPGWLTKRSGRAIGHRKPPVTPSSFDAALDASFPRQRQQEVTQEGIIHDAFSRRRRRIVATSTTHSRDGRAAFRSLRGADTHRQASALIGAGSPRSGKNSYDMLSWEFGGRLGRQASIRPSASQDPRSMTMPSSVWACSYVMATTTSHVELE